MPESTLFAIITIGLLCVWAALCFGAGKLAEKQGRSFLGFFLLALVFTPFLVIFLLLLLGKSTSAAVEEAAASTRSGDMVKVRCAECGEAVDERHRYCPNCGRELEAAEV
jgi:uncharacterized membrane protein